MNTHKYNLYARADRSPVYPNWVLIGQYTTDEGMSDLKRRLGSFYDEFKSEEK